MRKTALAALALFGLLAGAPAQTNKTAPAIAISAEDIQATLKKAPADSVTDQAIRTVRIGNLNVGVGVVHRSARAAQTSIEHDELSEIYHVLAGAGTLVSGGSMTKPERIPEDSSTVKELTGPSLRGAVIEGGISRKIKAGDVVIVPAGSPHWFSQIDGAIDYEVIRVDPARALTLK